MISARGRWIPSKIEPIRPGPSSTLSGAPVDSTVSPGPSPEVSSYTWMEALSPCISMISPIRRWLLTRTTSNMLASRIPSAMTNGPATLVIVPVVIWLIVPFTGAFFVFHARSYLSAHRPETAQDPNRISEPTAFSTQALTRSRPAPVLPCTPGIGITAGSICPSRASSSRSSRAANLSVR